MCVPVCLQCPRSVQPIQKAHGPEAMPSCPGAQKLPESTWSSHMVWKNRMTIKDSNLVIETFNFNFCIGNVFV